MKQIANVAALPGIVGVSFSSCQLRNCLITYHNVCPVLSIYDINLFWCVDHSSILLTILVIVDGFSKVFVKMTFYLVCAIIRLQNILHSYCVNRFCFNFIIFYANLLVQRSYS